MPAAGAVQIKVVKELARRDIVFAVAHRPGTARLFCGGSDFSVYELDLDHAKPEPNELGRHESYVTSLALAGATLISGGYDGRLIWWNVDSRSQVRSVAAHARWIRRLAATPDGRLVISVADDMVCRVWDVETGRLVHELRGHVETTPTHFPSMLFACACSPDGRHVATGDKVGHIVVWDLESGRNLHALEAPELYTWDSVQRHHSIGGIRSLAFSADGTHLAAGGSARISNIDHLDAPALVEIFDWQSGRRTAKLSSEKFKGLVEYLGLHRRSGCLLAAGGGDKDGFLTIYDRAAKEALVQEKVPMYVHDLALDEKRGRIYAVGHHKIAVLEMKGI
jgi:WD40 repeat protein